MNNYNKKYYKLDELGYVGRGKSKHRPRNDSSLFGGEFPFIQTGDVKRAEFYLTEYSETYNEKGLAQSKLWNENTLCITIAANIAENAILGIKACFPDSIIGFIPNEKKADLKFIKYCLDTYKIQIQSISQGATQDNLSLEKLRSINFLIPEISIQKVIGNVLFQYDQLIENNTKRIAILQQLAEQLYKEWFVRMRFPGHEKAKFVKGIPEGWELNEIKDFGKVVTGKTPSTNNSEYYDGPYPFIKTPDMHDNMFILETSETLSQKGVDSQKSQIIPANGISVSCIGTGGIVSITTKTSMTNQQINTLIYNESYLREYLFFSLRALKETIELFGATGATMTNLSKGKFEKLLIIRPDDEVVMSFNKIAKPIFDEIKNIGMQNISLKTLRDLLLPRLISGQLSVEHLTQEIKETA